MPSQGESTSVGVRLQGLPTADQTLVLASICSSRDGRYFRPRDIDEMFEQIGLPAPSKVSNQLQSLRNRQDVTPSREHGLWQLTPQGRSRAMSLVSAEDVTSLLAEVAEVHAPELGRAAHALVPPSLAPPALMGPLDEFLDAHPFDLNVFGMTRFPDEENPDTDPDPVHAALGSARAACAEHGLEFQLASDRAIVDDLWGNVAAHMWASRYGIAFFEDRRDRGLNYNLTIEVGGMLTTGRRCLLLKDHSIDRLPTDLIGMIYVSVDLDDAEGVRAAVEAWLTDSLGL